jgi:uncharacterized membrane protein
VFCQALHASDQHASLGHVKLLLSVDHPSSLDVCTILLTCLLVSMVAIAAPPAASEGHMACEGVFDLLPVVTGMPYRIKNATITGGVWQSRHDCL